MNIFFIAPSNRPSIMDAKTRSHTRLLEPYREGDTLELVCEVYGGKSTRSQDLARKIGM